jgi:hypothetical protein
MIFIYLPSKKNDLYLPFGFQEVFRTSPKYTFKELLKFAVLQNNHYQVDSRHCKFPS